MSRRRARPDPDATCPHPRRRPPGAPCPGCVQEALLRVQLESGDQAMHEAVQRAWPLDAQAAFGAIPTPLRLRADPRYRGRGVTMAMVDAGFFPHPDLVKPRNRIRAWADTSRPRVVDRFFAADEKPQWPGWDLREPRQWHGLMTSASAAGNGWLSQGLYRGLASEAELVLVQTFDERGRITNDSIARALGWIERHARRLGVRVVNLSVAGDPVVPLAGNPVDRAVAGLTSLGVTVVAAAGNDGVRRLVPPATAPESLTIGGIDDRNTFDRAELALWHSNYGHGSSGREKPELVAPSLWVVAPVLPGTALAREARRLFRRRAAGDAAVEGRIAELRLVTPHYQHVEGTSFAAPIVASTVACLLEAAPELTPREVGELLIAAAEPVSDAPPERQGAGALHAGRAVALLAGGPLPRGAVLRR